MHSQVSAGGARQQPIRRRGMSDLSIIVEEAIQFRWHQMLICGNLLGCPHSSGMPYVARNVVTTFLTITEHFLSHLVSLEKAKMIGYVLSK